MLVFRPVTTKDLDALVHLATLADYGLTTLPRDPDYLKKKVQKSLQSFARKPDEPGGEAYFFVLEDAEQIVGTAGIVSRVGGFEPFYMYEIKTVVQKSATLNVRKRTRILHLNAQHDGPCEIGTLFLAPDHRKSGVGRYLSLSRFLFIANHPQAFANTVLAEMRGVSDANGRSPFWEALGRHFFDIDFPKADYMSILNKKFIAELMPTHPIYIPLLPKEAQDVIGQVHERTIPALKILQAEGFSKTNFIDIFDAGPIVTCPLTKLRAVAESVCATVQQIKNTEIESDPFIVTNTHWDFRACMGSLQKDVDGVCLSHEMAKSLGVDTNDQIRYAPLYPPRSPE